MNLKACIFDLDGVIVNTAQHHFVAWQVLADELGVPFDATDNEKLKGVSRVDSLEYLLRKGHMVLDSHTKLQLMERKNTHYLELSGGMGPADILPGILPFIADLQASGISLALGSSSKNARKILQQIDLYDAFEAIVDGNNITLSKPDPEVFTRGAQFLDTDPSDCVVFEDAQAGIEAALNGGFWVIGVGDGTDLNAAHHQIQTFTGLSWSELEAKLSQMDRK